MSVGLKYGEKIRAQSVRCREPTGSNNSNCAERKCKISLGVYWRRRSYYEQEKEGRHDVA